MSVDVEPEPTAQPEEATRSEPVRPALPTRRATATPPTPVAPTKRVVPLGPIIIAAVLAVASGELVLFHWAGPVVALVVNIVLAALVLLVLALRHRRAGRARAGRLGGRTSPGRGLTAGSSPRSGLRRFLPGGRGAGPGSPRGAAGTSGRRGLFGRPGSPTSGSGAGTSGTGRRWPFGGGRTAKAGRPTARSGGPTGGGRLGALRSRLPAALGGTRPSGGGSRAGGTSGHSSGSGGHPTGRPSLRDRWRKFRDDYRSASKVPDEATPKAKPKPNTGTAATTTPADKPAAKPGTTSKPSGPAPHGTPTPPSDDTPVPAPPAAVADPAPRHAQPAPTPVPPRGGTVTHPVREAADQAKSAAAAYKPESLQKWGRDLAQLPDAIRAFADSIDMIRRHGDETLPAHKSLIEHLGSTVKLIREAANASDVLPGAYRSMHETDEDRLETPRGGSRVIEARADVSRAQDEI